MASPSSAGAAVNNRPSEKEDDEFGRDWSTEWTADDVRHLGESDAAVTTPMTRYRRRAWLSVTDWSSPSWCEVQSIYRLEARKAQRKLDPGEVLEEFASNDGNVITINVDKKRQRDHILQGGKDVHATLEKQVMGHTETVDVHATTKEEAWGLRLLNTILGLAILRASGTTRELPVLGLVKGVLTFGIIDQVERRQFKHHNVTAATAPRTTRASAKQPKDTSPSKQKTLDSFFSTSPSPSKGKEVLPDVLIDEGPRFGYVVSDSKTRYKRRMPFAGQTKGSRMQLMVYRKLLEDMVSRKTDWQAIFSTKNVDSTATFSDAFLASVLPILDSISPIIMIDTPACLDDLVQILPRVLEHPIEHRLEIVYYLRDRVKRSPAVVKKRKRSPSRTPSITGMAELDDELALQEIIMADLQQQKNSPAVEVAIEEDNDEVDVAESQAAIAPDVQALPDQSVIAQAVAASQEAAPLGAGDDQPMSPVAEEAAPEAEEEEEERFHEVGTKIGVESFRYNERVLDAWASKMLDFWTGKREPEGVPLEETHKCRSCEFEAGCEWRAKKAQEALSPK